MKRTQTDMKRTVPKKSHKEIRSMNFSFCTEKL